MPKLARLSIVGLLGIVGLLTLPASGNAQQALVYCPVGIDTTGCDRIVAALSGDRFPHGVVRGFDGSGGTVDLAAVDPDDYAVFMIPSLADDAQNRPYDVLRSAAVRSRFGGARVTRVVVWSGSPDQGQGNADEKADLLRRLAEWAARGSDGTGSAGMVVLLDLSADPAARYGWLAGIAPVQVGPDTRVVLHGAVSVLSTAGSEILGSGADQLAYPAMATFGLIIPAGETHLTAAAAGTSNAAIVLATFDLAAYETFSTDGPEIISISAAHDPVAVNTTTGVTATFLPAGDLAGHTAQVFWGNGSSSIAALGGSDAAGTATASHAYTAAGVYTIEVVVSNGAVSDAASYEFITVFNPEGEHVSGNGAIDSPPGAFPADPSLSGLATFGFQSRYRRGAQVPDGNTRFRFRLADLVFESTSHEWLVVSGARAQFRGRGTINKRGDYRFFITAIDGDRSGASEDGFRIRIWDGDVVVYDNQMGHAEDSHSATALARGKITIHSAGRNTAPVLTITSPADGLAVDEGTAISFSATALDTEEGNLSGSIGWSSSLDGFLHTGAEFTRSDLSAGAHTITASVTDAGGLIGTASISLTVRADESGAATRLAFAQQPTTTAVGAAIEPAMTVRIEDAQGNLVASGTMVTVALGTDPSEEASLSGTLSVAAVDGIATFADLAIDRLGEGYTLVASSGELAGATSEAFDVVVGTAAQLAFGVQPTTTAVGALIEPAVTVRIEDAAGNLVASGATVTIALGTDPSGEATLAGTASVAAINGIATFADLSIDRLGEGYTLAASAGELAGATSEAFPVIVGAAAQLVFAQQPTTTAVGTAIEPAVTVRIEDALGNLVASSAMVTVVLANDPGGEATLSGTLSVAAINGIATFGDLSIDRLGDGYTLAASAGELAAATSNAFDVIAGVATMAELSGPAEAVAGAVTDVFTLSGRDDSNSVAVFAEETSFSISSNLPGSFYSDAEATNPITGLLMAAGASTASFYYVGGALGEHTLTAAAVGYADATHVIELVVGPASRLAFGQQPTTTVVSAAIDPAVTVRIEDAHGNLVTTATDEVTLGLAANPGGSLDGTLTVAAVAGIATFADLSIDEAGEGYALIASAGELAGVASEAFTVEAPPSLAVENKQIQTFASGLLTITLSEPAGDGGLEIALTSNAPATASVPGTIFMAEGAQTVDAPVTAGSTAGVATITASGDGVVSGAGLVTVVARAMAITMEGLVGVGRTNDAAVVLAELAPPGGVTVNLTSSNPLIVSVAPASVFIAAGETEAGFAVTGEAVGAVIIAASATGYANATIEAGGTNTTVSIGTIPVLAPGESRSLPISLSEPAPPGGLTIFLESNDTGIATVPPSVTIAGGAQVPPSNPQVTGVAVGTATISARAEGFAPDARTATVLALSISISPTSISVIQNWSTTASINLSRVAPSGGLTIALTSLNPATFTVPASVFVPEGQTTASFVVTGVSAGTSTLVAGAPGTSGASASVVVGPTPTISVQTTNILVGKDLQATTWLALGQAPPEPVDVTLTVASGSAALLSTSRAGVGTTSITFPAVANMNTLTFYVQGMAEGATTITAQAAGFNDREWTVTIRPAGFSLVSSDFSTTTFSNNTDIYVYSYYLSTNGNLESPQEVRGGLTVEVPVTSGNTATGTITVSPLVFTAGGTGVWRMTQFNPLTAGTSTLSITHPAGFAVPANGRTSLTATVTAGTISVQTTNILVGKDLQATTWLALGQAPPEPVDVTLTVASGSAALLSTSRAGVGTTSITFPAVANMNTLTFYVQGMAEGATTITAQAAGFNDREWTVTIRPAGFSLVSSDFSTTTFSNNTDIYVYSYYLSTNGNLESPQEVRGGLTVEVPVTSGNTATGTITVSPLVFTAGGTGVWRMTQFNPLTAGTSTLSITHPAGFTVPANGRTSLTATVVND
jgi:hypothetical protein